jgi:predicted phage baseplate assembly protein
VLPAPNLDDRRFQDLVDDAKRLVQQRCPEWTDHNVSDPGVTLIETFAFMTDQLLYRLNRVPDRLHVAFLDLLGITLHPPTTARAGVTFWLTSATEDTVTVAAGTEAATARLEGEEAITFATIEPVVIPPVRRTRLLVQRAAGEPDDMTDQVEISKTDGVDVFSTPPLPDDVFYVGLDDAAPRCVVGVRLRCEVEAVGIRPDDPPLVWEAFDGTDWVPCVVDSDETAGLNVPGDVVLHIPEGHVTSVVGGHQAGWIRARVTVPEENQAAYSQSPKVFACDAFTLGGTADAVHGQWIDGEVLGLSEGVPGQQFRLRHAPVAASAEPVVVEVAGGDGWDEWIVVGHFADSAPNDRHVVLDASIGEVQFGPAVRLDDGSVRQFGAVPPKGAPIRVRKYRHGGGKRGNVAAGTIVKLPLTVPGIGRVSNRLPAFGGVDAETLDEVRDRAPIVLRTRDRAVTAEDYEQLAMEAAYEVARVRCSEPAEGGDGAIRLLVVPEVPSNEHGGVEFRDLNPTDETKQRIADYLEPRRLLGARVNIEPVAYQGFTVVASLKARPGHDTDRVTTDALAALYRRFHPLLGGDDGTGWPFGRAVHAGEVFAVLQRVRGVEYIEDVRLFNADPIDGTRGAETQRIEVPVGSLVHSFDHQLRVEA